MAVLPVFSPVISRSSVCLRYATPAEQLCMFSAEMLIFEETFHEIPGRTIRYEIFEINAIHELTFGEIAIAPPSTHLR